MRSEEAKRNEWIVLDLNSTRNLLEQVATMLYAEGFGQKEQKAKSISLAATVLGTGGDVRR